MKREIKVGNFKISPGSRPFIIAEIGTNHNGSLERAKKLIDMCSECGTDAIKFQLWEPEELLNPNILTKEYGFDKMYKEKFAIDVFHKYLKTPKSWFPKLTEYARKKKQLVIASVFSTEGARFVLNQGFNAIKIASMELSNTVMMSEIASITNKPVILSSGMSHLPEVTKAVKLFTDENVKTALLHCVSVYPPKYSEMHLNNIKTFLSKFDIPIGYSDHLPSNESAFAAIALGARIIEKHVTLDRKSVGPDHPFALERVELNDLVNGSKNIFEAVGQEGFTGPSKRELVNRDLARKSIAANKDFKKGEKLEREHLTFVRPGTGIQPGDIHRVAGKIAAKAVRKGSLISWSQVSNAK